MSVPESDECLPICASCGIDKDVSWWGTVGQYLCSYCGRN